MSSNTKDTKDTPKDQSLVSRENSCVDRYLYPEPRVRLGLLLARNRAASACIDLSDGLADGVHRIAEASGVGAVDRRGRAADRPGGARAGSRSTGSTRWPRR